MLFSESVQPVVLCLLTSLETQHTYISLSYDAQFSVPCRFLISHQLRPVEVMLKKWDFLNDCILCLEMFTQCYLP